MKQSVTQDSTKRDYNVYTAPCQDTHKALRHGSHCSFTCKLHHVRKRSPNGATPNNWGGRHLMELTTHLYRSRRDERQGGYLTYRMVYPRKCLGLLYPSATGRVQDREVRWPKTDVIPLFHAKNQNREGHTMKQLVPHFARVHSKENTVSHSWSQTVVIWIAWR